MWDRVNGNLGETSWPIIYVGALCWLGFHRPSSIDSWVRAPAWALGQAGQAPHWEPLHHQGGRPPLLEPGWLTAKVRIPQVLTQEVFLMLIFTARSIPTQNPTSLGSRCRHSCWSLGAHLCVYNSKSNAKSNSTLEARVTDNLGLISSGSDRQPLSQSHGHPC